ETAPESTGSTCQSNSAGAVERTAKIPSHRPLALRYKGCMADRSGRASLTGVERPMKLRARSLTRWWLVVLFAIGMAWVEAACVYYLRVMVDRLDPYQANPLPMHDVFGQVELVRE